MTPRELSPAVVTVKLEQISELLSVLDQMGEITEVRLQSDTLLRLALERVLTQLVELAAATNSHVGASVQKTNASGTYSQSFDLAASVGALSPALAAALKPSAGLRNILVHNYARTDWGIVVSSIPRFQTDYRRYVRELADWLPAQNERPPGDAPR